jgi:hypothetical protein
MPARYLQRYKLANERQGAPFGEANVGEGEHFKWYTGAGIFGRIGIAMPITEEGRLFLEKFTISPFELVLDTSPQITRRNFGGLNHLIRIAETRRPFAANALYKLIEKLTSGQLSHAFLASEFPDGSSPHILTFSPTPPPTELYHSGPFYQLGPVEITITK